VPIHTPARPGGQRWARVLATAADYSIDGKSYHVLSIFELERVSQAPARTEAAA